MIDAPTSAVIVSAILGTCATLIVGMLQFGPKAQSTDDCVARTAALESRVAVTEANNTNLLRCLETIQREMHELRDLVLESMGRKKGGI
jgi:hypothetical protein